MPTLSSPAIHPSIPLPICADSNVTFVCVQWFIGLLKKAPIQQKPKILPNMWAYLRLEASAGGTFTTRFYLLHSASRYSCGPASRSHSRCGTQWPGGDAVVGTNYRSCELRSVRVVCQARHNRLYGTWGPTPGLNEGQPVLITNGSMIGMQD